MWERLRSIWTVPDLRNKILFTLAILLITRILANVTVPLTGTELTALRNLFGGSGQSNKDLGQLLGLLDVFSGGSLSTFSIVAMGVYPYITATIVMQLLGPIIPALQKMQAEDFCTRRRSRPSYLRSLWSKLVGYVSDPVIPDGGYDDTGLAWRIDH